MADSNIPTIPSYDSDTLATKFYTDIRRACSEYKTITHTIEKYDFDTSHFVQPVNKLTQKFTHNINTTMKKKYILTFEYKNVEFCINIFTTKVNEEDKINNIIEHIEMGIIMSLLDKETFEESIQTNIDLYMTNLSKHLSVNRKPLHSENVSSSFSYINQNIYICVYRTEEWFKCLMYELFSSFTIDLVSNARGINYNNILSTSAFNLNANFSVVEPVLEFCARIFNMAYVSFLNEKSSENYPIVFQANLEEERVFSIIQSTKMLSHFGLKYSAIINMNLMKHTRKMYSERTNAFGFYVITSILFYHFDRIIMWLNFKDKLFDIEKNDKELVILTHYISYVAHDEKMIKYFDYMRNVKSEKKNVNMSLFEIGQ